MAKSTLHLTLFNMIVFHESSLDLPGNSLVVTFNVDLGEPRDVGVLGQTTRLGDAVNEWIADEQKQSNDARLISRHCDSSNNYGRGQCIFV